MLLYKRKVKNVFESSLKNFKTDLNRLKLIRPTIVFDSDRLDLPFQTSAKFGESHKQYKNLGKSKSVSHPSIANFCQNAKELELLSNAMNGDC